MRYFSHSKNTIRAKSLNQKGFTITEVVIVLLVVGAVIAVVLTAAGRLQRLGRNSQRNSDIQTIAQAISDYSANNNSALPGYTNIMSAPSPNGVFEYSDYQLSIYKEVKFTEAPANHSSKTQSHYNSTPNYTNSDISANDNLPDSNTIHVWTSYNCKENTSEAMEHTTAGKYNAGNFSRGSHRTYTIVYSIENDENPYKCING